jgi:hypothetical protein
MVVNFASNSSQSMTNPHLLKLTDSLAENFAEICIDDKLHGDWMRGVFGTPRDWQGLTGCAFNFTLDTLDETLRSDPSAKFVQKGLDCISAHVGNGWMAQQSSHVDVGDIHNFLTSFGSSFNFTMQSPKQIIETLYRNMIRAINEEIIPKITATAHQFIDQNIQPSGLPGVPPTQEQIDQYKKNVGLAIDASLSDANMRPDVMRAAERLFFAMQKGTSNIVGVTLQSLDDRVLSHTGCGIAHRFMVGVFGNAVCGDDGLGGFFMSLVLIFGLLAFSCLLCACLCCCSNVVLSISAGGMDQAEPLLTGARC